MDSILLEERTLMTIVPGQVYQYATYTDADGDKVEISVTGAVTNPATQGFTVELAGLAQDNADATSVNLLGLSQTNGVQVVVTPVLQPNAGPNFNNIYSAGYTNVGYLTAEPTALNPVPMTDLGGIQLSAAIVNSIQLAGISVRNISLDAGQAPYVDRINTTNNQQGVDSTMYSPVTGLIDLGGIQAANIDTLIINGAISAPTNNPYDTSVTNDFRSVINVSGRIGSIVGVRSNMGAIVKADSIGSVRVAAISGEIITKNAGEQFYINMPTNFKGVIDVAGHLNIGFPMSSGALITGQISAGGGISGVDRTSTTDTIYIPDGFANSLTNSSTTIGIANIVIDGIGMLGLNSASSVGTISANSYEGTFIVEAGTSIGNIDASSGVMEGHLQAGTDIGNIKATGNILASMIAGGNIGTLTTVQGNLESLSIQAGGNIGAMSLYQGILGTSIVAGGDLGQISTPVYGINLAYIRARNIVGINITDGSIATSSIIADVNIGDINTFGSITGFGIRDTSIVAGGDIGTITGKTHTGYGLDTVKIEAGDSIVAITGVSFGEFGTLNGSGISNSNFVAMNIGPVYGRGVGGTGIENSSIVTRPVMDINGNIDRTTGRIDSVTGDGWLDGLSTVTVVAHRSIGSITGIAINDGSGIFGGSYDANYGSIGQIRAEGGAIGGYGIQNSRFQSTDKTFGGINGVTASANANGLDAMNETKVLGATIGSIVAVVHGGTNGNGIVGGELRAYWGNIDSIKVDVRSTAGMGIQNALVRASLDIGSINVVAFNNTAISFGDFQARGNFGPIYAESTKAGTAIESSIFSAPGRTFFSPDDPNTDPYGSFGTITAVAAGSNLTDNAIAYSTFTAIGDMGQITAKSRGANGIIGSTFTANSDGDYDPNGTTPGSATGNIAGITVIAAGRNLASSSGIVDSIFAAANIGNIFVDVQTVEGGDAILRSTFTASTAIYDGYGNYDNTGRIGDITVKNASSSMPGIGSGISTSSFYVGAAGGFGNINVTTETGSGIYLSNFDGSLTVLGLDNGKFSSTIGNITVNTGRVQNWTLIPAGVTLSSFIVAAGIGNITVNSIGSGITGSIFTADFDWTLNSTVVGNIGNITVKVPGRNASAVTGSAFLGSSIGNIDIRLTDNAQQGINAVALSSFTAWAGSIGNINIIHSQTGFLYNVGLGYAIFTSNFSALTAIGSINVQGRTLGAIFTVGLVPVQPVMAAASVGPKAATTTTSGTIGPVTINSPDSADLTLNASGSVGPVYATGMPAGSTLTLNLSASTEGDINLVGAPGASPSLNLTTQARTLGNINVPGSLTLNAASATRTGAINVGGSASITGTAFNTMTSLVVGGNLSIPKGLPNLLKIGQFSAGSLSALKSHVMIGSKSSPSSSIGPIRIGSIAKGTGEYQFAYGTYTGSPNATIGGKSGNAKTGQGTVLNGARLILNTIKSTSASAKSVKTVRRSK